MTKKIALVFLGAFVIMFLLVGCTKEEVTDDKKDTPKQSQTVTYEDVDGISLIKEAQDNAAAANHKYKGKNVKITNVVISSIDSDGDYNNLNTPNSILSLMSISCSIDKKDKNLQEQVFSVKNGQRVIIYGRIKEIGDTLGVRMTLDKIESADANSVSQTTPKKENSINQESRRKESLDMSPLGNSSLGSVTLGDSIEATNSKLGEATKKTVKEANKLRYEYPTMDVAYDYGRVVGIAADDKNIKTSKGIHAGSSLQDVFNNYGKNYILSNYENLELYEYTYKDDTNRDYILRFAVKQGSGVVKYISIRYAD